MAGFSPFGQPNVGFSPFQQPAAPQAASPLTNSYKLYGTATNQQTQDYSNIMGKFNDFYSKMADPNKQAYQQSQDSKQSLSNLNDLTSSGGYSSGDINALRERGISPIRSIYASANRDVDRQRSLQGGFSPNYAATKAKMAREQSNQIADQMNDVNAGIAEKVAGNKMQAGGMYGSTAQAENATRNQYNNQNDQMQGDALRGMTSLYGTTPAMSQLFGSQALQGAGLQNDINQGNNRNNLQLISQMLGQM